MAVGLRYFNEKLWLDKYFRTLTFKEKFIWMHLITKKSIGGIFSESVSAIEGILNSSTIIEKMDNEEEYDERDYVTRKDITKALRRFNADKKLIKMEDGFYFFVNYYQNQNFKSQNNLEGVMARTEELVDKNKNVGETLKLFPAYFDQLGERLIEMLGKTPPERSKEKNLEYKQRMFLKYATLHDKVKLFFPKQVTDYLQAHLSMNYIYLYTKWGTKSLLSPDQEGEPLGDNFNLNLNPNFNFNFNLKDKLIVKDIKVKKADEKIIPLVANDFSTARTQEQGEVSAPEKPEEKKEEEIPYGDKCTWYADLLKEKGLEKVKKPKPLDPEERKQREEMLANMTLKERLDYQIKEGK
jgi:hypothetical protein